MERVPVSFDLYVIRLRNLAAAVKLVADQAGAAQKVAPDDVHLECYLGSRKRFVAKVDPNLIDDDKVIFERHNTLHFTLKPLSPENPEEFNPKNLKMTLLIFKKKAAVFRLNIAQFFQRIPEREPLALVGEPVKSFWSAINPLEQETVKNKIDLPVLLLKITDLAVNETPSAAIGGVMASAPTPTGAHLVLSSSQSSSSSSSRNTSPAEHSKKKKGLVGRLFSGSSTSTDSPVALDESEDSENQKQKKSLKKLVERKHKSDKRNLDASSSSSEHKHHNKRRRSPSMDSSNLQSPLAFTQLSAPTVSVSEDEIDLNPSASDLAAANDPKLALMRKVHEQSAQIMTSDETATDPASAADTATSPPKVTFAWNSLESTWTTTQAAPAPASVSAAAAAAPVRAALPEVEHAPEIPQDHYEGRSSIPPNNSIRPLNERERQKLYNSGPLAVHAEATLDKKAEVKSSTIAGLTTLSISPLSPAAERMPLLGARRPPHEEEEQKKRGILQRLCCCCW